MDGQFLLSIVALLLGYEENSTIPTVRGCFICVNISLVIILVYISSFVGCAMNQTAGLSPRRPVFNPRLVHVGLAVGKVALRRIETEYFGFPLSVSFHPCPIPIYSSTINAIWCHKLKGLLNNAFFSCGEGHRSRSYGRTAALRLIVQPCDEDD